MSTITKKMSQEEISKLYTKLAPVARAQAQPAYTHWQLKLTDCTITAYTSGKVVFQGKDLSWLEPDESSASATKENKTDSHGSLAHIFPQAGSDEVGTGDYFGPVVVAAVIVPDEKTAQALQKLQVTDSKTMTDAVIEKIAPEVANMLPHSIQIVSNDLYNRIWDAQHMNMNRIKARMHNQSYLNLQKKGYALPDVMVVDQFCPPKTFYGHLDSSKEMIQNLHFETKAESHYIAVAAASVLARAAFLNYWKQMDDKYHFSFEKGGGKSADESGKEFVALYGADQLVHVAKLHFANTKKILGHPWKPE